MRNEGSYILEWLAYHRSIGFADVVIGTKDCVDGSPALLDRLHERGLPTHQANAFGPEDKPQLAAYARAESLPVLREADWAMVLDADEFLNIHVGQGRVDDLIDAVPEATAFLINWRLFGHSSRRVFRSEMALAWPKNARARSPGSCRGNATNRVSSADAARAERR